MHRCETRHRCSGPRVNAPGLERTGSRNLSSLFRRGMSKGRCSPCVTVNTLFDLTAGRMQYVYVLGDLLVTKIDVRLHAIDAMHTRVEVTYARTALRPEANAHVGAMGKNDSEQGKVWEDAVHGYLQRR